MSASGTTLETLHRLDADTVSLAEAVSIAVRIEPQLLRKIRIDLIPSADAGTEADLWFSSMVETRSASAIVLRPESADALRQRLREKPALLHSAWRIIESLHTRISPPMLAEERMTYLALSGRYGEMRQLLRSAVAALVTPQRRGLAGWAARAFERLPAEARLSEEAQMLMFGSGLRLDDPAAVETALGSGGLPEWALWLAPPEVETAPFGVALLEDGVEFGPPGRSLSQRIELPKTNPVLVELSWEEEADGFSRKSKRVQLQPNKVIVVDTGPAVTSVDIRTVLGAVFTLSVPARRRESVQKKLDRLRPPRVHITYDIETGGAIEKRELPFVVGVLANLIGHQSEEPTPLKNRRFVQIDRDNFDQVLSSLRPRLEFKVEDKLNQEGANLRVDFTMTALADFEPVAIIRQVPPLAELLHVRTGIATLRNALAENEELETLLMQCIRYLNPQREDTPPDSVPDFAAAVRALGRDGLERPPQLEAPEELVRSFLNTARTLGVSWEPMSAESVANSCIQRIDAMLSQQLGEVLHQPDFQKLEATWRGLYYLVNFTETSTLLKIKVMHASKRDLLKDFGETFNIDQTALYKKVYEEEYGVFGGEPFAVLLGDYHFDHWPEDIRLLESFSHIAAASHTPFIAAAGPGLMGLQSFTELSDIRDLSKVFVPIEYAGWRLFRESEDSRYAGLMLPRILLRLPYGRDTVPLQEFEFEEVSDRTDHEKFLWGNAAFALGARLTDAFARYGWCAAIRGVEGGGLVEGLPVFPFRDEWDQTALTPTEIAISDRREKELADAGFIPLQHCKGTDYAAFFSVRSVQKIKSYDNPEASANAHLATRLEYIFAVSRFVHYLKCLLRDKIVSFMSRTEAERFLNQWIMLYVHPNDDATATVKAKYPLREARIEILEQSGRPGVYRGVAYLRPDFQLDELTMPLRVAFELPAASGPPSEMA